MREIKYRMWNKKEKKMYDVGVLDFDDKKAYMKGYLNYTKSSYLYEDIELMQFTGLYDKNGKEIYEGDIVSKETFDDTKPNYRDISYAKVVWIEELASYHLVNKDDKILWDLASDKYNIEVASNIYENSDLLKGADNIEL